jgi:hypothetical protein
MGFLRHKTTKIYQKRLPEDNLAIHFVQVKSIPDGVLPSIARFHFDLTLQNYSKK